MLRLLSHFWRKSKNGGKWGRMPLTVVPLGETPISIFCNIGNIKIDIARIIFLKISQFDVLSLVHRSMLSGNAQWHNFPGRRNQRLAATEILKQSLQTSILQLWDRKISLFRNFLQYPAWQWSANLDCQSRNANFWCIGSLMIDADGNLKVAYGGGIGNPIILGSSPKSLLNYGFDV